MLDRNESMLYSDKYMELNQWTTAPTNIYEEKLFNLREYRPYNGFDTPILILAPLAGHDSKIIDYDNNQSQVQCALDNSTLPIYAFDWKEAKKHDKGTSYEDLLNTISTAMDMIGCSKIHLVGSCMAGALSTIYTAINPTRIESLSIAGTPIAPHAEPSVLDYAIKTVPMWSYKAIVDMCGGVMPGEVMLSLWKSSDMKRHYFDKYQPENDTYRAKKMYSWYDAPMDISGDWYLWIVENLFKKNRLVKGEMKINNKMVNLLNIDCKLNIVVGTRDPISPPKHSTCLADLVSTPKENVNIYEADAAHIGVFMGTSTIKTIWTEIFKNLNSQS